MKFRIATAIALSLACAGAGLAQTKPAAPAKTVSAPLPPEKPKIAEQKLPAKVLFSEKKLPSLGHAMAIGYYPRGCLQGGVELPVDGPNWQVMRLSRNRNWGHPELVKFLERFAPLAAKATGWKGILVGDMAQPRGGPLPFGHMSHQIGLDVDIWFMPEPDHELSKKEREEISASNLVAADGKHVNPKTWTPSDVAFIRTAAEQPEVERVLVNAAIKKELCRVEDQRPRRLDGQGAALVRPRRPHPRAAEMPGRFAQLPQAAAGAGRRRLRGKGTGLLVQGFDPASQAGAAGQAVEGPHAHRPAAGLQKRARRAGQSERRGALVTRSFPRKRGRTEFG